MRITRSFRLFLFVLAVVVRISPAFASPSECSYPAIQFDPDIIRLTDTASEISPGQNPETDSTIGGAIYFNSDSSQDSLTESCPDATITIPFRAPLLGTKAVVLLEAHHSSLAGQSSQVALRGPPVLL